MKLMSILSCLLSATFMMSAQTVFADEYTEDLQYFRNALKSARFADTELELFKDPTKGKGVYRLNEQRAPWAGNYFPMDQGGISNRWQEARPAGAPLRILDLKAKPSKETLQRMTAEQINRLSPAEKYDIMMGDYEFSATKHELQERGPLRRNAPENWEGFCNGVRAAGILLPEPSRSVDVVNKDGIHVTFNIADLKALAGVSYFYVEKYSQLGSPSRDMGSHDQPNAAVFDLALRYFLAHKKKAFVIDSHLGGEIWNESVIGYRRELQEMALTAEEKLRMPWATKKLKANVVIETLGEVEIAESDRSTRSRVSSGEVKGEVPTSYILYVDAAGKARDGIWKNAPGERGIDFAWFGGGRGTDAHHTNGEVGNPWLDFGQVKKLFTRSAKVQTCKNIFSL